MSEITEKFCEECGKKSPIGVKFCKFCGVEFPVIDHPDYVRANAPAQNLPPQEEFPYQQSQPTYPPQYPPQQQVIQPQGPPQYINRGNFMRKPPRVWQGGGLVKATLTLYSNPIKTAPGLMEDPQAPNSIWIIFVTAISAALVQYFTYLKTNFTKRIGDDLEFFKTFTSSEAIQNMAINFAILMFLLQFVSWFILSWLLAATVKNGLPVDSYLLHSPSKSMRQLTGFLYIPTLLRNIVQILLLQFEDKRDASIKKGRPVFNTASPEITYLTTFSNEYFWVLFIIAAIMAIITALTFYRSIKHGLNHNGSSPAIITFFIILYSIYIYYPVI